jgi:uncharacterized protein YdhG (YjbR/CyaY superfamily)
MPVKKQKPGSIEAYMDAAPGIHQPKLKQLHQCILKAAPGATQDIKWGMPAYSYQRILVSFAIYKNHIGFYPTPSVITAFATLLAAYPTAAASVQFALDKPLPLALITKMVKYRVSESREFDAKWKS